VRKSLSGGFPSALLTRDRSKDSILRPIARRFSEKCHRIDMSVAIQAFPAARCGLANK
jgi:hypothetical protein